MTQSPPRWKKFVLVILSVIVLAAGAFNALWIRRIPIQPRERGGDVVIAPSPEAATVQAAYKIGDVIRGIDGISPRTATEANWLLHRVQPPRTAVLTLQRDDSLFVLKVVPDQSTSPAHILLTLFLGAAFIVLGLSVWWFGRGDPLVLAFLRLNLLAGVAIVLDSPHSAFALPALRHAYALGWIACYCVVPAALIDFVLRFTRSRYPRNARAIIAVFAPSMLLAGTMALLYARITVDPGTAASRWFAAGLTYGLGAMLLGAFFISFALIFASWKRAESREDKNVNRWLLVCTLIGLTPFVLLHKFPTLWGGAPLISLDLSLLFLAVTPIGWGMAVASFRLLHIEHVLSRTLVYVTSAGIVVYLLGIFIAKGTGRTPQRGVLSWAWLAAAVVFIIYLAGISLAKGIRQVVDRFFYGDWFDFRNAVQDLGQRMACTVHEPDIVRILTENIPKLLRVERAILLIDGGDDRWIIPAQQHAPADGYFHDALSAARDLLLAAAKDQRVTVLPPRHPLMAWHIEAALPLMHSARVIGWLLLGQKESHSPYSVRDLELVRTLSSISGIALANLQLHQELVARECRAAAADLAGGIAHEINNALYPLKGQAQLLRCMLAQAPHMESDAPVLDSVDTIIEMSNTIQGIAEQLNHLAKPNRLQPSRTNINQVVQGAIQLLTETAGRIRRFQHKSDVAPYRLQLELSPEIPELCIDADQMRRVMVNLILNAADAIESCGQGTLTIGTRQSAAGDAVICWVADTGAGIPAAALAKIFQPYFTTKPNGSGLGLSIVQSIVDSHGGQVKVFSKMNIGTRIEVILPLTVPNRSCT